jgi:hypothetical protein
VEKLRQTVLFHVIVTSARPSLVLSICEVTMPKFVLNYLDPEFGGKEFDEYMEAASDHQRNEMKEFLCKLGLCGWIHIEVDTETGTARILSEEE